MLWQTQNDFLQVFTTPLLDGAQRVTGFGDFGGYGVGPSAVRSNRLRQLCNSVQKVLPGLLPSSQEELETLIEYKRDTVAGFEKNDRLRAWTGLRPQSADNLPIIGNYKKIPNLYVNSGSGVVCVIHCIMLWHLCPITIANPIFLRSDGQQALDKRPY